MHVKHTVVTVLGMFRCLYVAFSCGDRLFQPMNELEYEKESFDRFPFDFPPFTALRRFVLQRYTF